MSMPVPMAVTTAPTSRNPMRYRGLIVDSWAEPSIASHRREANCVTLQVRFTHDPKQITLLHVPPSLIPDEDWYRDFRENLCHGLSISIDAVPTREPWTYRAVTFELEL